MPVSQIKLKIVRVDFLFGLVAVYCQKAYAVINCLVVVIISHCHLLSVDSRSSHMVDYRELMYTDICPCDLYSPFSKSLFIISASIH